MNLIYRWLQISACFFLLSASCGDEASNKTVSTDGRKETTAKTTGEEKTYSEEELNKFTKADLLKTWRYESLIVDGSESLQSLTACQKELRVTFKDDNTFQESYIPPADDGFKGLPCPDPVNGTWQFDAATNQLTLTQPGKTTVAKLTTASSNRFEGEIVEGPNVIKLTLVSNGNKK